MPEILGQYFLCECYNINDCESDIVFVPANDFLILGVLNLLRNTSKI